MSVNYTPFNGTAGMITVKLFRRSDNVQVGPQDLRIYNFEFSEKDEESALNEIFSNINDELIKDFYGYRKRINFTLVNGGTVQSPTSATNKSLIRTFVTCINLINSHPKTYRMQIQYRSDSNYSMIDDAIFVGDFELLELKEDSNVAQKIKFEFVSRKPREPILLGNLDFTVYVQTENMLGAVLLETGEKLTFETQIDVQV